jgi:hypothetical protein
MKFVRGVAVALVAASFALTSALMAQNPQPPRMRGAVTAIEGRDITVSVGDGALAKIKLTDDWSVLQASKLDPAKIPQGSFVGAGAAKQADGSLKAVRIIVFPESMRGTGEGARPWAEVANGQMTNAAVTATVTKSGGPVVTVTTGGKSYDIDVPADALVVLYEEGARDLVKVGANISFAPNRAADGTMTAGRLLVGKNGEVPPL